MENLKTKIVEFFNNLSEETEIITNSINMDSESLASGCWNDFWDKEIYNEDDDAELLDFSEIDFDNAYASTDDLIDAWYNFYQNNEWKALKEFTVTFSEEKEEVLKEALEQIESEGIELDFHELRETILRAVVRKANEEIEKEIEKVRKFKS